MALGVSLLRKGSALGLTLCCITATAQEIIERGNQANPWQPPAWFARLASPELDVPGEIRPFVYQERPAWIGKPQKMSVRYVCGWQKKETGGIEWQWCEM